MTRTVFESKRRLRHLHMCTFVSKWTMAKSNDSTKLFLENFNRKSLSVSLYVGLNLNFFFGTYLKRYTQPGHLFDEQTQYRLTRGQITYF